MMFFILLTGLLSVSALHAQQAAAEENSGVTFKSGVSNVRIDVQVLENGKPLNGLNQSDFAVFDEQKRQPIVYFGHDADKVSLLLLLDVSGSTKPYIEQIASVAREALRYLMYGDRVAIMAFARNARVTLPWSSNMSDVAQGIRAAIHDETLGSATNINDALLEASRYIDESAGESGRRAVLILTDNLGLNYKSPDDPVIQAMFGADTVVNAIVVGKGRRPEKISGGTYQNPDFTSPDVFRISEETGGEAIRVEQAGSAFADMIQRIRTRYSLHYNKPHDAGPGFRKVEVMLSPEARQLHPKAVLHYRRGYISR